MVSRGVALREARKIRARGKIAKVIPEPRFGINEFVIQVTERKRRK